MKSMGSAISNLLVGCGLVCVLSGCAEQQTEQLPPRIAVVIDTTGSFQKNLKMAADIVSQQIRTNALEGDSEIYLIRMDDKPEVTAHFGAEELINKRSDQLLKALHRVGRGIGTDVVGALELALRKLERPPIPSRRYLLVFGDLIVDNAPRRKFRRLDSFAWDRVDKIESHFYFVNPNVQATLEDIAGMSGSAVFHDPTESQNINPVDTEEE